MGISRHEAGQVADLKALASQVHPVFMIPALLASLFGGSLANQFDLTPAVLHLGAVFTGLYIAHVKDGYVDYYERGEDDSNPLTEPGCKLVIIAASFLFGLLTLVIWDVAGTPAALITIPGWFIGYFHAPQMDMNTVTTTFGYPSGITLAFIGGHLVQAPVVPPVVGAYAVLFFIILSGIIVVDDAVDYEYDQSIGKPTVAVLIGRPATYRLAYGLIGTGLLAATWFIQAGLLPTGAVIAVLSFAGIAGLTLGKGPERSTELLIRGSYLFIVLLGIVETYQIIG